MHIYRKSNAVLNVGDFASQTARSFSHACIGTCMYGRIHTYNILLEARVTCANVVRTIETLSVRQRRGASVFCTPRCQRHTPSDGYLYKLVSYYLYLLVLDRAERKKFVLERYKEISDYTYTHTHTYTITFPISLLLTK